MIPRLLIPEFKAKFLNSKFLLVVGPRNCGKNTFISQALAGQNLQVAQIDCANKPHTVIDQMRALPESKNVIVLSEAQHLADFDELIDSILRGQFAQTVIAACSFKPLLDEDFLEALRIEGMLFNIYAPTFYEAAKHFGLPEEERLMEERLIFGNYPSVIGDIKFAEITLRNLITDVVETHLGPKDRINKGDKLLRLMQLLAFGIGEPLTYNDLGDQCGIDNETVERYILLLEQASVLIKLPSFHTEQRYELKKSHCFYFFDNGIRNALISNFNPSQLRNDMPSLWKNYLISERVKWVRMSGGNHEFYFWRTHTRQQIDFIEVESKLKMAYKMDWEKRKKIRVPKLFNQFYPDIKVGLLQRNSYWNFLTRKV